MPLNRAMSHPNPAAQHTALSGTAPASAPPAPASPAPAPVSPVPAPAQAQQSAQALPPEQISQPFLEPWRVQSRCAALGVGHGAPPCIKEFTGSTEFIGLGCFCAVSYGLQALDLKKKTYPFDWLRSPMDGIVHLLETDFEDFLTFTTARPSAASAAETVFAQARWGGSFWHHVPENPQTAADFTRRIERLLGLTDDVVAPRRVFVRALNSTRELEQAPRLLQLLREALPGKDVRLLLLVDLQSQEEMIRLEPYGDALLIRRVAADIFAEDYSKWSIEACVENYARGVAAALKHWAGADKWPQVRTLQDLPQLLASCDQMDGGNAATEMYWPRLFKGQRIAPPGRRAAPAVLPRLLGASHLAAVPAPAKAPQAAEFAVPQGSKPGDVLTVRAFNRDLQLTLPLGALPGRSVRLTEADGMVSVNLVSTPLGWPGSSVNALH